MTDNKSYLKYIKYKNKYINLKKSNMHKIIQYGGNSNLEIYNYFKAQFENTTYKKCGKDFNLKILTRMLDIDTSSTSIDYFGSGYVDTNGSLYAVAVKIFPSRCSSIKRADGTVLRVRNDKLKFINEIRNCKKLTEMFLITNIIQNIVWYYYGNICRHAFKNDISICSGNTLTFDTPEYNDNNTIFNPNSNPDSNPDSNPFVKNMHEKYLEGIHSDAVSYLISEKCEKSLRNFFRDFTTSTNKGLAMEQLMSIILQILLALNIINNKLECFNHNDLHSGNILLVNKPELTDITYNINGANYIIPTHGIIAKIWDFGNTFIEPYNSPYLTKPELPEGTEYDYTDEMRLNNAGDINVLFRFINNEFIKINEDKLSPENQLILDDIKTLRDAYIDIPTESYILETGSNIEKNIRFAAYNKLSSNYLIEAGIDILNKYRQR
jgi:hypothetical protein